MTRNRKNQKWDDLFAKARQQAERTVPSEQAERMRAEYPNPHALVPVEWEEIDPDWPVTYWRDEDWINLTLTTVTVMTDPETHVMYILGIDRRELRST